MEDLAAAVQSILNDPQSMAQLQGVMNSLGMNPPQAPAPATPPGAAKTGGRRAAQFAEHSKQQRSDDGDAFARRAAFGKREPRG